MTDIAVLGYTPSELAMIYVTDRVRRENFYRNSYSVMLTSFRRIVQLTERWCGGFDNFDEYFAYIDKYVGYERL